MAYIGKQPLVGNFTLLDSITATTTDTYALTKDSVAVFPQTPANCIVSLNGVIQAPTDSYTISGSDIVFASALTGSDSIDFITVLGDVLNVGTVSDGTIGLAKLSATGTKDATTFLRGDNTFASAGGGKVLQVVTATDSTERTTTSTSFVTASNTLSVTITPSSASNKIFLTASLSYQTPSGTASFFVTLFRGATNLGNATYGFGNVFDGSDYMCAHATPQILDSPNTTSATTYQFYFRVGGGTGKINNNGAFSSITAFEIQG
jgi:hypothetical protein